MIFGVFLGLSKIIFESFLRVLGLHIQEVGKRTGRCCKMDCFLDFSSVVWCSFTIEHDCFLVLFPSF